MEAGEFGHVTPEGDSPRGDWRTWRKNSPPGDGLDGIVGAWLCGVEKKVMFRGIVGVP